jgi:DNA-binding GntR family transcriptional regulator
MHSHATSLNDISPVGPIARQNLHDEIVSSLRDSVVEGRLKAGERLNERFLCEQFGISRTPLREAFKVLAAEGLLTLLPNRGATVTPLTREDFDATVEVLAHLESLVGSKAAEHATQADIDRIGALHHEMKACFLRQDIASYFRLNQQIHLDLAMLSRNKVLFGTYASLNGKLKRYRYMANQNPERWRAAVEEHGHILDAFQARDGKRLAELLRLHLINKAESLRGVFSSLR